VDGLFLHEREVDALRRRAEQARNEGIDAVFLGDGPLGDAIVLAGGLAAAVPDLLFGVRVTFGPEPHRHPTILARDMTTLDHVCGGRAILAFMGPFDAAVAEAIRLCRAMWSEGIAVSDGPYYPVVGAINRPLPKTPGGPPIALDLTDGVLPGPALAPALLAACDLVLLPADAAPPEGLPTGVDLCRIRGA
jgi:alkanesulfonate monooxygenase SsuD/methylene tetrahydromethanopterin reductase-like flavin-dependent oxidoreductase (luciferase family)